MFYVYVLISGAENTYCVSREAYCAAIDCRVAALLAMTFYEACKSRKDAFRREKYLKTGMGKRYLRDRLSEHLETLD